MIFDHGHTRTYAALSERCQDSLLKQYNSDREYSIVSFKSTGRNDKPFCHTWHKAKKFRISKAEIAPLIPFIPSPSNFLKW